MRKIATFFYGIGQGFTSLFRNRMFSLASIGTMAACLFLFGIFYIVLTNFRFMVKDAETNVGITVFFDEGVSDDTIVTIGKSIKERAEVHKIEFTSAQEAWENYKKNNLSEEMIATFGDDNPLKDSASYTVFLNDLSMQDSLIKYITGLDGVRKVNDTKEIAGSLSGLNSIIAAVSGVIILVLLFVALFLIGITVSTGVTVRKQEISIMKLIGASDYFIKIPFIVEGMLIGLIGAAIPLAILRFFYNDVIALLSEKFASVFKLVSFLDVYSVMKVLAPATAIIGVGVGLIGSNFSLRRQLKKIAVKE